MTTTTSLKQELANYFGFTDFMPGQEPIIELLLHGKSAVAIFPTGSGKSLCYQLPALFLPGITLVVSPLLSLMKDQLDYLQRQNIPAARLDSTLQKDEYNQVLAQARSGELKILMISVERFKNERFRYQLKNLPISLMVVDEAHCISEWGHNFRPEYLKIPLYQKEYGIKQVLLLTATATEQVQADMAKKFNIPVENFVVTGFYRKNLFLKVTPVEFKHKDDLFLTKLIDNSEPAIVYVTLQKTAERVADLCNQRSIPAVAYHAGLGAEERERIQTQFMCGQINVIVATIAFGMGIDKKNIRKIIHYDLPKSMENYSQEIGRAGRDQENALCEVLANKDHINILENFIYGDTPEEANIKQVLKLIKANPAKNWEIKFNTLSNEVDIRLLPLKTLLVYLEMEEIILPRYTYFEYYSFKSVIDQFTIVSKFTGERQAFVQAIFEYSKTSKIWTVLDFEKIIENYPSADRERIIKCLEYLEQKGWIELEAKIAVEVFEVL
ncbi:MAG: RecQ family ATP-dependent DNA helicase, partial [Candidatus Margulisiibacteriota bacterium]